jgi:hypothetical protein
MGSTWSEWPDHPLWGAITLLQRGRIDQEHLAQIIETTLDFPHPDDAMLLPTTVVSPSLEQQFQSWVAEYGKSALMKQWMDALTTQQSTVTAISDESAGSESVWSNSVAITPKQEY